MPINRRSAGAAATLQHMGLPLECKVYPLSVHDFIFAAVDILGGTAIAQPPLSPLHIAAEEGSLAAPQILVPEVDASSGRRRLAPAPDYGWYLMGWIGLAFLLVGGLDLALAWYPPQIGNPQWEFGTVSRTYDNLAITALGLTLLLGAGVARGVRWWTRTVAVLFLVLAVLLLAGFVLYLLNIPLALKSVTDPVALSGLKRAMTKTMGQAVVYTVVFFVLGLSGLRYRRVVRV